MSGSQIYIQIILAVKNKEVLIETSWEDELNKYITEVSQKNGQKMIAISGMPDHIHLFIKMTVDCVLNDFVEKIKELSTKYINENKFSELTFNWQAGFGAFSHSKSEIKSIKNYFANQKTVHETITFKDEFIDILKRYEIEYQEKDLFDWIL